MLAFMSQDRRSVVGLLGFVLAAFVFLIAEAPARADSLTVAFDTSNVNLGFLDVSVTNSGASTVFLDGFAYGVTISDPGDAGAMFTNAITTTDPALSPLAAFTYLFSGGTSIADQINGGPGGDISSSPPGATFRVSDTYFNGNPSDTFALMPGLSFNIGRVLFTDAAMSPNPTFSLVTDQKITNFAVGPVTISGDITGPPGGPYLIALLDLQDAAATPEPATIVMANRARSSR